MHILFRGKESTVLHRETVSCALHEVLQGSLLQAGANVSAGLAMTLDNDVSDVDVWLCTGYPFV